MSDTPWLDDVFAAMMVATALYSLGRLVASEAWSRPTHRDVDIAHILMGASMAGQLVSELNPVPTGVWEAVFACLAVWFVRRCYQFVRDPGTDGRYGAHVHRLSRRLIHLMMALAMLYMYLAAEPARIGTGMAMGTASGTASDFVLIPTIFILAFLASAVWQVDAMGRLSAVTLPAPAAPAMSPVRAGAVVSPTGDLGIPSHETVPGVALPGSEHPGAGRPAWLAPRLEAGAHIAMVVTMAYMLVLML